MSEFWSQKFETGYYDKILQNGLIKNRGLQPGWHNITFLKLKKYVLLESVHLDYACGPGTFIGVYIKNDSIGIDLSKNQISYAKDKYGKYGKFFSISDSDISNYKNHFDVITIAGLLEFLTIKDAIQLISNLQKSLKKDGRIILTTPNYGGFFSILQKIVYLFSDVNYENDLVTKYSSIKIKALLSEGSFKNVAVKKFMTIGWLFSMINLNLGSQVNQIFERLTNNKLGYLFLLEIKRDN
jgi:SAM-dependent methyltransferase